MTIVKKNKPKFNVPNLGFFKSVKARWRKPRGTHNKKRMKAEFAGALPKIGYRNPPSIRDLHPSGMKEVLVNNLKDLDGLKSVVIRIASGIGGKKRKLIEEKAKSMKLDILNIRRAKGSGESAKVEFGKGKKPKMEQAKPPSAMPAHGPNTQQKAAPKSPAQPQKVGAIAPKKAAGRNEGVSR